MKKMRKDNHVTNRIGSLYAENKIEPYNQSNRVRSMMKTKQDNNVIDRIGMIFVEYNTELSRLIR